MATRAPSKLPGTRSRGRVDSFSGQSTPDGILQVQTQTGKEGLRTSSNARRVAPPWPRRFGMPPQFVQVRKSRRPVLQSMSEVAKTTARRAPPAKPAQGHDSAPRYADT